MRDLARQTFIGCVATGLRADDLAGVFYFIVVVSGCRAGEELSLTRSVIGSTDHRHTVISSYLSG